MDEYLTIMDIVRETGVNDKTVRRWIKSGELRAMRDLIGRYRITRVDFEDFRRKREERYNPEKEDNEH